MADFLAIEIKRTFNLDIPRKLAVLVDEVMDEAADDVAEYTINVLHQYPPKRSVSRQAAYGVTFFSDKQRRFFFAALRDGTIEVPYKRTQTLRQGWKQVGSGRDSIIANETSYGPLVMGDEEQSRMTAMIGWPTISEVVENRLPRADRIADAAAKKIIKDLGL